MADAGKFVVDTVDLLCSTTHTLVRIEMNRYEYRSTSTRFLAPKDMWGICIISLLVLFFCTSCGYDPTPIKQQLTGTWERVAVDYLINDTIPEEQPPGYATLTFTAEGTYTQTFSFTTYSGEYTVLDSRHIRFINKKGPGTKSNPPHTVEFQLQDETLILTDIGLEKYQRVKL